MQRRFQRVWIDLIRLVQLCTRVRHSTDLHLHLEDNQNQQLLGSIGFTGEGACKCTLPLAVPLRLCPCTLWHEGFLSIYVICLSQRCNICTTLQQLYKNHVQILWIYFWYRLVVHVQKKWMCLQTWHVWPVLYNGLSFVGQLCGFIKCYWQSQPWWLHVLLLVIIINAKWKPLAALLLLLKLHFKSLTTLRPLLWIWEFLNSTFSFLSFCGVVFIFHWALLILWLCCSSVFTLLHIAWNSRQK